VAFSPDGQRLASAWHEDLGGGAPDRLRLWDLATTQEILSLPVPGGELVMGLAFTADGRRLVTTWNTGAVRVWDSRPAGP
jgi:WD40 repeat protein